MKITHARITALPKQFGDPMPEVHAVFEDGREKKLFEFYPDELSFAPEEFVGLTYEDGCRLKFVKDREYLRG